MKKPCCSVFVTTLWLLRLLLLLVVVLLANIIPSTTGLIIATTTSRLPGSSSSSPSSSYLRILSHLEAAKSTTTKNKKKKTGGGGGGFGGGGASTTSTSKPTTTTSTTPTVSADKNSLEKQWDIFAAITDLEITPKGNPEDEDYIDFEVVDVFVKCGATTTETTAEGGTKWFRIGKVCSIRNQTPIDVALKLQKGLIFWTAVHMRRELVAAGGKSGAAALQLGYISPPTLNMGSESDGPLDEDEEEMITLVTTSQQKNTTTSSSFRGIQPKTFGFRPDWNPPGFTYKRREKAAMKKKVSSFEEMKSLTTNDDEGRRGTIMKKEDIDEDDA